MVPFSIALNQDFMRISCVGLFKNKFILSKCQNAKYAESMQASYLKKLLPGIIFTLIGDQTKEYHLILIPLDLLQRLKRCRSLSYELGHSITTDLHGNKDGKKV